MEREIPPRRAGARNTLKEPAGGMWGILNEYFPIVEILSRLMNEQYNLLREKFPSLIIERHQVLFQPKTEQKLFLLSTNILTLLYHFSDRKRTLPLWREEFCWELFLKGDSRFAEKKIFDTINQNPTPAEKEYYSAVCQRKLAGNEKRRLLAKQRIMRRI